MWIQHGLACLTSRVRRAMQSATTCSNSSPAPRRRSPSNRWTYVISLLRLHSLSSLPLPLPSLFIANVLIFCKQEFRQTFDHFDHNKNDSLDKLEFRACLASLSIPFKVFRYTLIYFILTVCFIFYIFSNRSLFPSV